MGRLCGGEWERRSGDQGIRIRGQADKGDKGTREGVGVTKGNSCRWGHESCSASMEMGIGGWGGGDEEGDRGIG